MGELRRTHFQPRVGKRDAPLEKTVGDLELTDRIAKTGEGRRTLGAHYQCARLHRQLDAFRHHARHGDDHDELALVLEHIDRRLPQRLRARRRCEPEELPVHALGLRNEVACLRPHPVCRVSQCHGCPSGSILPCNVPPRYRAPASHYRATRTQL